MRNYLVTDKEKRNNKVATGIIAVVVLISFVVAVCAIGIATWKISENEARSWEAKSVIASVQPEIIVARSQANINNSAALTVVKDNALIVVLIIVLVKDVFNAKARRAVNS